VVKDPRSHRGRGFTFLEVLFAVIIVGIGFIMIAAIFPVAIAQTQANVSEATGVAVGRDAMRYLQGQLAVAIPPGSGVTPLPVTNEAVGALLYPAIVPLTTTPSFPNALTYSLPPTVAGLDLNAPLTADRRFAWTALYRRDTQKQVVTINAVATTELFPSAYAQLFALVSQNTAEGQATYGSGPQFANGGGQSPPASNFFSATINGSTSIITINSYANISGAAATRYTTGSAYDGSGPVGEGAFALIIDLNPSVNAAITPNQANQVVGWYGQLGTAAPLPTGSTVQNMWYLQTPPPFGVTLSNVYVFILGKPVNPAGPLAVTGSTSPNYDGPVQDVTMTSGFVRVNN
jgi:type II secretory pathway pseudopilin PulG